MLAHITRRRRPNAYIFILEAAPDPMQAKKDHVCRVAARPLAGQPLERHRATNSLYFQECSSGAHAVRTGSRAGCGETSRGRVFPWIESAPVPCSIAYHFQPKRNSGRKSSPVWISHNMFLRPGGAAHHRTHLMCLVVEDYDVSHNAFYLIIILACLPSTIRIYDFA